MFDLRPDEARLLLNIALMAIGRNRFCSAALILAALERFRSDQPALAVAKTLALMSAGNFELAAEYAGGRGLEKFPRSAMLKAFRGMALLRLGRGQEARNVLEEAAGSAEEPEAAKMAKDLLKG